LAVPSITFQLTTRLCLAILFHNGQNYPTFSAKSSIASCIRLLNLPAVYCDNNGVLFFH
jgi:hypothetical protein